MIKVAEKIAEKIKTHRLYAITLKKIMPFMR
jgi:hypothetical protein